MRPTKITGEMVMEGWCNLDEDGMHTYHPSFDPRFMRCACGAVRAVELCPCCGKDYAFCPCSIHRDNVCETHYLEVQR